MGAEFIEKKALLDIMNLVIKFAPEPVFYMCVMVIPGLEQMNAEGTSLCR